MASIATTNPVIMGLELNAPAEGKIKTLILRDAQHIYPFEAVE